ncbi:hypothetical protein J4218_06870 [Candidatus Pacearchaeota archaeon]|nr:hypothetical protein [Candidatus Pacearchaeota archaeon]
MKRGRLEIIKDILKIIQDNHNSIKITPLIRKSNISSNRFKEYYLEIISKQFIKEIRGKSGEKLISITEKGTKFLEKYSTIIGFLEEFDL